MFIHTLSCGMPVIVERIEGVRSASITWLVPGGVGHDGSDDAGRPLDGRASVTSELLLRGAAGLSSRAQADAFDRLGAARSADAGVHFMRFSATMLGERSTEVLPLLVDTVLAPSFDPDAIGPSQELALQAIESLADDPGRRAALAARARHLPDPFGRSGLGTPEGIERLTRDNLVEGWARTARPRGSILAVAGDVDADALVARLEPLLAGWEGSFAEPPVGPEPARGYAHEPDDGAQVQVIVAHDAPPERDGACVLERVVVGVLSGGMSARLFTEVREKRGLCYSVHASYRAEKDHGVVFADVGTTPERAQESLDVLLAELDRINRTGVEPGEFARATTRLKSSLVFAGESTSARAASLASDVHKLGRPRSMRELGEQLDAVTLERVNAYLATRRLGRVTIQTLGPAELVPPGA